MLLITIHLKLLIQKKLRHPYTIHYHQPLYWSLDERKRAGAAISSRQTGMAGERAGRNDKTKLRQ